MSSVLKKSRVLGLQGRKSVEAEAAPWPLATGRRVETQFPGGLEKAAQKPTGAYLGTRQSHFPRNAHAELSSGRKKTKNKQEVGNKNWGPVPFFLNYLQPSAGGCG